MLQALGEDFDDVEFSKLAEGVLGVEELDGEAGGDARLAVPHGGSHYEEAVPMTMSGNQCEAGCGDDNVACEVGHFGGSLKRSCDDAEQGS